MEYECSHRGELNTIKILNTGGERLRFIIRSQKSRMAFEEMEILLSRNDIDELKQSLRDRNVGRTRIGKFSGICRQYLSIERETGNSPLVIIINKWFIFFGGCFSVELYREESEEFLLALEAAKF